MGSWLSSASRWMAARRLPTSERRRALRRRAARLDEMFPGRVILCLGVGAPADLAAAGIASPKPLKTIAEAVAICRSLLAGETAAFQGEVFRVSGRRLASGARKVAIMLAASRPNMLK